MKDLMLSLKSHSEVVILKFNPAVEIFQVERGVEFSMIYMEDVTKRLTWPNKGRAKVGFSVLPGFKIGRVVIQSQVYISNFRCTE